MITFVVFLIYDHYYIIVLIIICKMFKTFNHKMPNQVIKILLVPIYMKINEITLLKINKTI